MADQDQLAPLATLFESPGPAQPLPLPPELTRLYGALSFPSRPSGGYVIANFVETLDGVISLNAPGKMGGGEISGFNQHDHAVMGLLRAAVDAVVVGAGTLRAVPRHIWTAEHIYPPLTPAFQALRSALGKAGPPVNVIVTGSGQVDLGLRVFSSGAVKALIVTTPSGAERLAGQAIPPQVQIASLVPGPDGQVRAADILQAISARLDSAAPLTLLEGGPNLMGDFFGEGRLDELFLTLAPQVAGREGSVYRLSLVEGRLFAPGQPLWGRLTSVKQAGSHLFLRYSFESDALPQA
jgi:riboflavin biosynthesis pyrimidine reductase